MDNVNGESSACKVPNKSRNTMKFLLAVTPNGVPCFVSQCFGGRISDKELTRRCGILGRTNDGKDRLESGDAIMADKHFDIDDILQNHVEPFTVFARKRTIDRRRRSCQNTPDSLSAHPRGKSNRAD